MSKKLSMQIFWAISFVLIGFVLGYLGIFALQKSMTIKMSYIVSPNIRCEIYITPNVGEEYRIFSNLTGDCYINDNWTLYENTSTLKYLGNSTEELGALYTLRFVNHTNTKVFAEAKGEGVTYVSTVMNATNGGGEFEVSAVSSEYEINFYKIYDYTLTASFTNVQFDLTDNGNTLLKCGSNYYIPLGEDLVGKLKATTGYIDDTIYNVDIRINDVSQNISQYINNYIIEIPTGDIIGNIEIQANAETYWDGTTATSFAGGTGTQANPYKIANGKQLALLASIINTADGTEGTKYAGTNYVIADCRTAYYEMFTNIYLNDETFTVNETTGLATISDGIHTGTIGTGINSTTLGAWTSNYQGQLNNWTPIGNSTNKFSGQFNGNNKTIFNSFGLVNNGGIFGCVSHTIITNMNITNHLQLGTSFSGALAIEIGDASSCENINLMNIYIFNSDTCGSLCGIMQRDNCIAKNIIVENTIIYSSGNYVGGVFGLIQIEAVASNISVNNGHIYGNNYVGGIYGVIHHLSNSYNCYINESIIRGASNVGGICGHVMATSQIYNHYVGNCTIYGSEKGQIVGVSDYNTSDINNNYWLYDSGLGLGIATGFGSFCSGNGGSYDNYSFDASQTLTTTVLEATNLTTALNNWLSTANTTDNTKNNRTYFGIGAGTWQTDSNINNGYPYFA